ncbi:MAG: polysaccharide biosynthesis C-terminal domain-containing protein, partial [Chloroflexota bacterium]|nr:polysaccharide biosynthesis C-terminal domain-containing protein [Chloroflexota bacterium]
MRSVTHGSLVLFFAQVIANVGFFAAVLMVARALGPDGRGTIAFVIVSALVLARISEFGVADATLVFASRRASLRPALLANFLMLAACVGVLLAVLGVVALTIFGPSGPAGVGMIEVLLVVVGAVAVTLTDASDAFLLGSGRIPQRAVVLVLVPWMYAGLIGLMLVAGILTVTSAATVWAISMVSGAAALVWLSYRVAGVSSPNIALLRESITFGTRAWVGNVAGFLNMRLDQILLGILATEAALGMYAVAVNGAEILLYFPAAVTAALIPALARAEPDIRHEQALRGFRILGATTVMSVLVAAVAGPLLLAAVFGPGFQASVVPFLWLLPGAVGYATKTVFSSALLASSSPGLSSVSSIAALVTGVVLDLLLIPGYGATGAAFAASAAFLMGGVVALVLYRRRHRFAWTEIVPRAED